MIIYLDKVPEAFLFMASSVHRAIFYVDESNDVQALDYVITTHRPRNARYSPVTRYVYWIVHIYDDSYDKGFYSVIYRKLFESASHNTLYSGVHG